MAKTKKEREIHLTAYETQVIAEKSGYSPSTVDQVLRGRLQHNQRHRVIFDLYDKLDYLRSLHRENYLKDLTEL